MIIALLTWVLAVAGLSRERRRPVLAVPGDRAWHVRGRAARTRADHRRRAGLLILPLSLVCLAGVAEADSGAASSLLNAGRQVGGSVGLAVLGTVAWTVIADTASAARGPAASAAYQHALAAGFDRAFLVAAGIALLILVVAIAAIRVRRADLSGSYRAERPRSEILPGTRRAIGPE